MLTDGAALNRWRLVLGKNAQQQLPLAERNILRMDDALDFLYSRESGEDVRDPQGARGQPAHCGPLAQRGTHPLPPGDR